MQPVSSRARPSVSTEDPLSASTEIMSSTLPRKGPLYKALKVQDAPRRDSNFLFPGMNAAHSASVHGASPSHSKTLQSIAKLANKYLSIAKKQPTAFTIRDEELTYLRAIERSDLEEVREILSVYDIRGEVSSCSSDDGSTSDKEEGLGSLREEGGLPFVVEMNNLKRKPVSSTDQESRINRMASPKSSFNKQKKIPAKEAQTKDKSTQVFNKNCCDEWGRTGLFIAISRRNLDMVDLLLQNDVDVGECLYHAIDFGYYDVVEMLLKFDNIRHQVITGDDSFYPPGLTPIQLAAHKNDFIMLKILHNHGFRIIERKPGAKEKRVFSKKKGKHDENSESNRCHLLETAWDESNDRVLYYKALASPAYMIMMHTEGGFADDETTGHDFLDRIFRLYGKLKKKAGNEPDARSMYLELAEQVERFSCELLNQVRSAEDLSNFLRFDPPNTTKTTLQRNHLLPIQTACEVHMKNFVAHRHCQLAMSILRSGTLFSSDRGWKTSLIRFFLALMFPFLCIAFIIAPNSRIGSLLRNPMVNLSCHMVSDITFLVLMVVRLSMKWYEEKDCLGSLPNAIEIVICSWVLARTVNEVKRMKEERIVKTFSNIWKINDLSTLTMFYVVVVLRCLDIIQFNDKQNTNDYYCNRTLWQSRDYWPLLVSEGCMAFIYILIFIRAMEMTYIDRTFGPLQLSLDKMLLDVLRFGISFFLFTFFAFACAMAQLYWAYGRPRILRNNGTSFDKYCEEGYDKNDACYPVYASIHTSLLQQFWTIFGYGYAVEPPQAVSTPDGKMLTEYIGFILSGLYHCWAVIVMLNMLIAMMSHSFDRVRDNAEVEWKFLRTNTWMKYLRKHIYPRPPPMNLIPSPRDIISICYSIKVFFTKCKGRRSYSANPQRRKAQRTEIEDLSAEPTRYRKTINIVTSRYLRKHLLEEFQHDEDHQLLLQTLPSKNASPRKTSSVR